MTRLWEKRLTDFGQSVAWLRRKAIRLRRAGQERLLSEIRQVLQEAVEQYPKVQEEPGYRKYLNAAESYEKMLHTSGLIYNDTVSKYNGTIRLFPVNVAARLLHFHKNAYLEMG